MHGNREAGDGALPHLVLYSRPGCHLCDETRAILGLLLAQRRATGRAAPDLIVRDISTDPAWEREYFASIPVVELGDDRLALATSAGLLRALLDRLDAPAAPSQT